MTQSARFILPEQANRITAMTINVSLVTSEQRTVALRILFARFPVEEQPLRLAEALQSAERGSINLDCLLLAEENGQPVGAALTMHQRDGTSLVWPPVVTCQTIDTKAVEDALMARLCDEIDNAGSKLAQVLLALDDVSESDLLKRFGFQESTEMFFLVRPLTPDDVNRTPNDSELDHILFNETTAARFESVIERTYIRSLDCAFLNGFRKGKDAIESHRLSGCFDPAGWRLYCIGSQDVGVLLMNEHPDRDAIELTYFGIVPEFRGRGLGREILADGIQAAAMTDHALIFLAVDCGNIYANSLYGELGFSEMARRRVMIRRSARVARE